MRLAIAEACKAMGRTHPNPAVGAVIVHQGEVVARGHTLPAGQDHAEVMALRAFRETGLVADPTTSMAVTLEPCSTTGRTPPCTEAIIASGIGNLVVGATDPNPAHAGAGFSLLEAAGVSVAKGVLEEDCQDLNLIFNWRMSGNGPFFAGKIATTLDGRIATRGGSSKWITSDLSRQDVHCWRRYFPAIAVGAGTVIADDPSLTIRQPGEDEACPVRFIFDRNLITFHSALPRVYSDAWREKTIIVTDASREAKANDLTKRHGLCFWTLEGLIEGDGLSSFSQRCLQEGIEGVLVEGGSSLLSSFLASRKLYYLFAYRAPKLLADASALPPFMGQEPVDMEDAIRLERVRHATFGDDQLLRGFVVYPGN